MLRAILHPLLAFPLALTIAACADDAGTSDAAGTGGGATSSATTSAGAGSTSSATTGGTGAGDPTAATSSGSGGGGTGGEAPGSGGAGGGGAGPGSGGAGPGSGGAGGAGPGSGGAGGAGPGSGGAGGAGSGGGGGGLGVLGSPSYDATMVFQNEPVVYVPTGIAWDGTNLWVSGNGNLGGYTSVRYDADGTDPVRFQLSFGFTNIFTKGDGVGPIFGRGLSTNLVHQQLSPTQWSSRYDLDGASVPTMASFAWDAEAAEHICFHDGALHRWDAAGNALAAIPFEGYGEVAGETSYPQDRRVVAAYGHYLTYSDTVISAWDATGARVAMSVLNGAGTADFESSWSFSFAQGKVWVVDSSQGSWRGYVIAP